MKKPRRNHRSFERFASAVRDLLEEQTDDLMLVSKDVNGNKQLLLEIKKMLEKQFILLGGCWSRQVEYLAGRDLPGQFYQMRRAQSF